MKLSLRSDRKKNPETKEYRYMTAEEARNSHGKTVQVIDQFGKVASVKVTSVKTWKTRPHDVDVNWKFGMYEYGTESFREDRTETLLIVEIYREA